MRTTNFADNTELRTFYAVGLTTKYTKDEILPALPCFSSFSWLRIPDFLSGHLAVARPRCVLGEPGFMFGLGRGLWSVVSSRVEALFARLHRVARAAIPKIAPHF
jgi:hypothetical protein